MKKVLIALLISASAQAEINGIWQTETNEEGNALRVDIQPCANDTAKFCGIIQSVIDSDKNVITEHEHVGKTMIKNMVSNDGVDFEDGTIWAPDKDKTYNSKMELNEPQLSVSGCVMGGLICRSQTWQRISE